MTDEECRNGQNEPELPGDGDAESGQNETSHKDSGKKGDEEVGKVYVTADTHFGDDGSIVRYEGRPFQNGGEMNEALIAGWNRVVGPEDTVYHLGDVVSGLGREETEAIVGRLNGHKILIMGNHDTIFSVREWMEMGFEEVYSLPVIYQKFYILSHEPVYVNRAAPYANLFGHVHKNPAYRDVSCRSCCVCVERTDYVPVTFESIQKAIWEEEWKEQKAEKRRAEKQQIVPEKVPE